MPNKKNSSPGKKTFVPERGAPSQHRRHGTTRQTTVRSITFVRNWESGSPLGQLSFDLNNVLESVGTAPASPTKVPVVIASPLARPLPVGEEDPADEEQGEEDHAEEEEAPEDDNFVPDTQSTPPTQHKGPIDFDQDDEPVVSESPESERPSSSPKTSDDSPDPPHSEQQEQSNHSSNKDSGHQSHDEQNESHDQEKSGTTCTPLNIEVNSQVSETPSRTSQDESADSLPVSPRSVRKTPSVHERISPRPVHKTRSSARKQSGSVASLFQKRLQQSLASAHSTPRMSLGEASVQSFNVASVLRTPKSGPVVRTSRKRPHAMTVPMSPKHTCVKDTEGHEVRLWQGDQGRRGVSDILDLDILLNIFEETAWETRQQMEAGATRKALNSFAKETQKDFREAILQGALVKKLQSSLNKSQRRLNKSRKHLLTMQQRHTELTYKIAKLKQARSKQS